ncbi:MAG: LPXTG cell wall anchor domain-containing protein [Propionicimonas sp.]
MPPKHRLRRRLALLLPVSLLTIAGSTAAATPALAVTVGSIADITTALTGCTGTTAAPTVVTLAQNIAATTTVVTVPCVAELDLAGFELQLRSITINSGQQLTIDDSATGGRLRAVSTANSTPGIRTVGATLIIDGGIVTAQGGASAAGIGGPTNAAAGTIVINDGVVTATGGGVISGAGIGGVSPDITINGGTVTASGGAVTTRGAAGIGGSFGQGGGTITINGGTVVATGSGSNDQGGAGIGGGTNAIFGGGTPEQQSAGVITITGGDVTATGGSGAAGIGAGKGGRGDSISITGGTVTAIGSEGSYPAAGLGGGYRSTYWSSFPYLGSSGTVLIGEGADVTATGGHTAVGTGALGSAQPDPTAVSFGPVTIAGTLRIPSGQLRIQDSDPDDPELTVSPTGRILGGTADPTSGATIEGTSFAGTGQIQNDGVIALTDDLVTANGVAVLGHHYAVSFDVHGGTPAPGTVTVFAPSFDAGYRDYPAAPTRGTDLFKGWNTAADGSGTAVSAATILSGASLDGGPVPSTVHARWATAPVIDTNLPGDALAITTTSSGAFTPTVADADGEPYPTDPADWTITDGGGLVDASIDPASGEITVRGTTAGSYTLTLSVPTAAGTITAEISVTVGLSSFATGPTASFTGVLRVGETLTAEAGPIDPVPDAVEFTWFADGVPVGTGPSYQLTAAEQGKWISLRAVATRAGYAEATSTSDQAGPVVASATEPPTDDDDTPTDDEEEELPATGAELSPWLTGTGLLLVLGLGLLAIGRQPAAKPRRVTVEPRRPRR